MDREGVARRHDGSLWRVRWRRSLAGSARIWPVKGSSGRDDAGRDAVGRVPQVSGRRARRGRGHGDALPAVCSVFLAWLPRPVGRSCTRRSCSAAGVVAGHQADADAFRLLAAAPPPRTVVWLDELQRYLDGPGGTPAAAVRAVMAAGAAVVATIWPGQHRVRTVDPPGWPARPVQQRPGAFREPSQVGGRRAPLRGDRGQVSA
jgi:hypothetical protein